MNIPAIIKNTAGEAKPAKTVCMGTTLKINSKSITTNAVMPSGIGSMGRYSFLVFKNP
jgi:hypothetical protein